MEYVTTYCSLVEMWLQEHKKFIKESTYANYRNIVDNHLLIDFGNLPLTSFSQPLLQNYVIEKLQSGSKKGTKLSVKTVRDIMVVLKLSLRYAFTNQYVDSFDMNIKYPKLNSDKRPKTLNKQEVKKIINSVKISPDQRDIGIIIALYTGLRIGEVCALKYSDYCNETCSLTITKTLQRIYTKETRTKIITSTPKSSSSFRKIPVTRELSDLISPNIKSNDSFYILSNNENPVEPRILRKRFNNILEISGVKHYKFHSLRHTFATNCIEANVDAKTLSVLLGHSNINTTLNLYVHPNNEQKKRAIQKLIAHLTI